MESQTSKLGEDGLDIPYGHFGVPCSIWRVYINNGGLIRG